MVSPRFKSSHDTPLKAQKHELKARSIKICLLVCVCVCLLVYMSEYAYSFITVEWLKCNMWTGTAGIKPNDEIEFSNDIATMRGSARWFTCVCMYVCDAKA